MDVHSLQHSKMHLIRYFYINNIFFVWCVYSSFWNNVSIDLQNHPRTLASANINDSVVLISVLCWKRSDMMTCTVQEIVSYICDVCLNTAVHVRGFLVCNHFDTLLNAWFCWPFTLGKGVFVTRFWFLQIDIPIIKNLFNIEGFLFLFLFRFFCLFVFVC